MSLVYSQKLPLGWQAPSFALPDVTGQTVSLSQLIDKPGLLVAITCNHCPYARAGWPFLVELADKFKDTVRFVAINPNDEQENSVDGIDGMKKTITEFQIPFPYLRDKDQQVTKAYQAQCTPDVYLFKNQGDSVLSLFYHGRINDNWQHPDLVTKYDLKEALEHLIGDQDPPLDQNPSMGCSIKWLSTSVSE